MELEYIGHACFRLATANGFTWVTDPYDSSIGLAAPAVSANVTTLSHGHYDHNYVSALTDAGRVISAAGNYDVGGVKFELIKCYHDDVKGAQRGENLITICEADGLRVCHMGDIGHQPDAALIKAMGHIDVMLIPVGGTYTLDGNGAAQAVRAISPVTVIPMHFKTPRLHLDIGVADDFLNDMGEYENVGNVLELSNATRGVILMAPAR